MENKHLGQEIEPVSISYFVRPPKAGEARFVLPPQQQEALPPKEDSSYWGEPNPYPAFQAEMARRRHRSIAVLAVILAVIIHFIMSAQKNYWAPLAERLPLPANPRFGQVIYLNEGTRKMEWIYCGPYGWIDP